MKSRILIDFHNLFMMVGKDAEKTKAALAEIMKMARRKGEVEEVRLFAPIYHHGDTAEIQRTYRLLNTFALTFGLESEICAVSSVVSGVDRKMKDSVDNAIMMHIVRHVHRDIGPDLIVFVTGDGDFVKFSTMAQNKASKKTEFWSVDPNNTNGFIKQEGNFQEIETDQSRLEENLFLASLDRLAKKQPLGVEDRRRLRLVANLGDLNLQRKEIGELAVLLSEHLGITYAESDRLVEMLATLKVAEIRPTIARVVDIDYTHSLFQYLRSTLEPDK